MRPILLALPFACWTAVLAAQNPPPRTLTLKQAMALGRERGVAAALARLNERIAEARVGQRRADLLPSVVAAAGAVRQTRNLDEFGIPFAQGTTDPFTVWSVQLRASETLFDWSALTRLRAARDSLAASGADTRAVGDLAATAAGLAYLRVLSAEETVRAREADSSIAAALLDQARAQVAAGTSPAIDATRSEVQLAAVRTQLEVARNQRDRARLDLARALDLPPETPLHLADTLVAVPADLPADPDQAVAFALDHRPEVAAERARTRVLEQSLRAIGREYLPSLALNGSYQQTGRELDHLRGTWLVQLQVSAPLLDGFRRPNRQREQEARLDAARLRLHDTERQVATEARQALLDVASAEQQVHLAGERLRLAEQELAQAEERFEAGVAGSVETTAAQGGLVAARDALIQARVAAAVALLQADRALGRSEALQ
ncbi:MAG TPA: TolC family protein [Gemmatimonadales bacterium]|nr:TolC family protein [Gemmatimonadales bacterium]